MIVSVHQPNFLPYLGFFEKILKSDIFIVYDTAQFSKENFMNRNRINSKGTEIMLTLPVSRDSWHKQLKDVYYYPDKKKFLVKKQLATISNAYSKTKYFEKYFALVKNVYEVYERSGNLLETNMTFIRDILTELDWKGKIVMASSLNIESSDPTDKLIEMVRKVGGTAYLCGPGSKKYMDFEKFNQSGIKLVFQESVHNPYFTDRVPFLEKMSVLDYLFFNDSNLYIQSV